MSDNISSMEENEIIIREIADIKRCSHFQVVAREVWGCNDLDIVPAHALITIVKNGGVVLGAFAADGPPETEGMVGIVLDWPGMMSGPDGKLVTKHCSHQVGVLPGWRGRDIGLSLKLAQREAILAQGATDLVTWTYDPLQRVNGAFTIHRLGATSNTYMRDVYGELEDAINAGLPTDRLQVDWRLSSDRVMQALAPDRQDRNWPLAEIEVLQFSPGEGALRTEQVELRLDGDTLAAPLPESVEALRKRGMRMLIEWRMYLRAVLEQTFAAGYVLVDCIELPEQGWFYILTLK